MRSPSMLLGKIFGVEVRLHSLFLLFLVFSMSYSAFAEGSIGRGLGLWLEIFAAVAIREIARALAYAWCDLPLRSLTLLPTGAVAQTDGNVRREKVAASSRLLALAGPVANFCTGITLALFLFSATASVNLFARPWVTPAHLLRSLIWTQVLLGGLHLIPAYPLDAGVMLREQMLRLRGTKRGMQAMAGISQMTALALVLCGIALSNVWMMVMGSFLLVAAQTGAESAASVTAGEDIVMRDVMLTDFSTLSASDTLEDALSRSVHSLQDVFPVTRGPLLVGAVSRQTLVEALRAEGNGYVQGSMTRTFHVANAGDGLGVTLQRIGGNGSQMVPVVDGEQVLGIVTPQNLSLAMQWLARTRKPAEPPLEAGRNG